MGSSAFAILSALALLLIAPAIAIASPAATHRYHARSHHHLHQHRRLKAHGTAAVANTEAGARLPGWYAAALAEHPELATQLQAAPMDHDEATRSTAGSHQHRHHRSAQSCMSTRDDILGPYFLPGAPHRHKDYCYAAAGSHADSWKPLNVTINLFDGCSGKPLSNARGEVQVWQADNNGEYDNTKTGDGQCASCGCRAAVAVTTWTSTNICASSNATNHTTTTTTTTTTTADSSNVTFCVRQSGFKYATIVPASYGEPGCLRPAHIHHTFHVTGYKALTTQMYFKGDKYLGSNDCGCGDYCHSGDGGLQVSMTPQGTATWDVYLVPKRKQTRAARSL